MNEDLALFYSERAQEYEKVYSIPEEQADLREATVILKNLFAQKTVLEIACGTGYWTEKIAETATSIHATDIIKGMIELAEKKHYKNPVTFEVADAYHFRSDKKYESVFVGFFWNHILLQDLDQFMNTIKNFVTSNGMIVFIDSNKGNNRVFTKTDEQGNTYETRKLGSGTTHLVLKNFPSRDLVLQKLSRIATEINFINLTHFWMVSCKINGGGKAIRTKKYLLFKI